MGMNTLSSLFATLLLCLAAMGCNSSSGPELHVFMWGSYIKPEILRKFEQEHKCRVLLDTYDSNEAMYSKLKLGAAGYDLIFPSNYYFEVLIHQKMLQAIDFSEVPNSKDIDPKYLQYTNPSARPFGVPYMVSNTGIAFRKDKIPQLDPTWRIRQQPIQRAHDHAQ